MFNTHLSNIFSFITFPTLMCVSVYIESLDYCPVYFVMCTLFILTQMKLILWYCILKDH